MKDFRKIIYTAMAAVALLFVGVVVASADEPVASQYIQRAGQEFETVAASQTDQVLGAVGAVGDVLDRLVIVVTTAATSAVSIEYGSTNIAVFPDNPGGGIGTYVLDMGGIKTPSGGGWEVTTGAGSAVIAIGRFTD